MSSLERMLKVLDVFSVEAPVWTVESLSAACGYTRSTAYRYVRELCDAGLLAPMGGGGYSLGPRIIELDRQIRDCDPLIVAAEEVMAEMIGRCGEGILFLCALHGDSVISIYRRENPNRLAISYSRGRPIPLFRGSASRVILAHMPERRLRRVFREHGAEIAEAGLGNDWRRFWESLREIAARPYLSSRAQLDPGVFGMSAPVFDGDGNILASLTLVVPEHRADREAMAPLSDHVVEGAARIGARVGSFAGRAGAGAPVEATVPGAGSPPASAGRATP